MSTRSRVAILNALATLALAVAVAAVVARARHILTRNAAASSIRTIKVPGSDHRALLATSKCRPAK
jgi:hypothetical protein